jgi:alpha/beta superfamily hydrolase
MAKTFHHSLFLDGPAGRLEAMLWTVPDAQPERVAVVCHPHPLFGGTLHNKVVFHVAKALHSRGYPVLRFNFRGAGLSQGTHDQGRGEADDIRAALCYLAAEFPGRPVLLAGFSFGAWVGLRVGSEDDHVTELMGLGIPVNGSDMSYLLPVTKPKLFLHGSLDPFGSLDRVKEFFSRMAEPKELVIFEGAGHFFEGKLDEMAAAIEAWLIELHTPGRSAPIPG